MSKTDFISRDDFKKKFGIRNRIVAIKSTGDKFQVKSLPLVAKREIRQANMVDTPSRPGDQAEIAKTLDVESYMVDIIIKSCVNPSFDDTDKMWLMETMDANYIQELYAEIDTPVKLTELTSEKMGN